MAEKEVLDKLIEKAFEMKEKSYCPYSKYHVGAGLLTKSGKIYGGMNIENSSYGATICAERTAVFKAVSEGEKKFSAIVICGGLEGVEPKGSEVDYAFQKLSDIPSNIDISSRIKPWGTVQAVLCAKDKVEGSFVVVNADDFYGYDSFYQAAQFLDEHRADNEQACISYPFSVTKSDVGAVKRGVLKIEGDIISSIIESSIEVIDEKTALATPLDGSKAFKIDINAFVSMNMFAFQNYMFQLLEDYFQQFFLQDKEVVLSSEALLPECIKKNIMNKNIVLYNKNSNGKWLGMTYKEDLEFVKREIRNLKNKGEYPSQLWR